MTGGMSSFSAVLIVSAFLQWHTSLGHDEALASGCIGRCGPGDARADSCCCSPGKLLLDMCEQHANQLDYVNMVFSAVQGYTPRDLTNPVQAQAEGLFVQDPFDEYEPPRNDEAQFCCFSPPLP